MCAYIGEHVFFCKCWKTSTVWEREVQLLNTFKDTFVLAPSIVRDTEAADPCVGVIYENLNMASLHSWGICQGGAPVQIILESGIQILFKRHWEQLTSSSVRIKSSLQVRIWGGGYFLLSFSYFILWNFPASPRARQSCLDMFSK